MAIYPKCDHTLYGVFITKTKTLCIPLSWSTEFCFFLSSFPCWALDHLVVITSSPWSSLGSTSWHVTSPYNSHTLSIEVSRFHQLSKTKLGLLLRQVVRPWITQPGNRPNYLGDQFGNVSLLRFHQLSKTKLGLSPRQVARPWITEVGN